MKIFRPVDVKLPKTAEFLLIELVVVVSLLGITASFAIPRFTRLANNARASEVVALAGKLRVAAEAAHAQYLAADGRLSVATFEGRPVALTNGYPDSSAGGMRMAVLDWGGFTVQATPTSITYIKSGAPSGALCSVIYAASPHADVAASVTELQTSGC